LRWREGGGLAEEGYNERRRDIEAPVESRMLKAVEGVFRNGKVSLLEPAPVIGEPRVIVTFLSVKGETDLPTRGMDGPRAAELRKRLRTFAEDWSRPEMDVYDAI
jgi:hypothetical protein